MKVTQVAIRPTESSDDAGRPALTPELLAASGARYSRNNEGLEAILSKIDPSDLDKSVDNIFRMIDYGHQSIADMAPVSIFFDGISILLAYLVWSWCPTAGGQESSTRYIKLDRTGIVDPNLLGVPEEEQARWFEFIDACFDAYGRRLRFWNDIGQTHPRLTRIPADLLRQEKGKAQKQVARMRRNFAFDRSRYFLPVAAMTNMMMVMSARGWVQLCQCLLSHWLPEAHFLGEKICEELSFSSPRMVKHAEPKASFCSGYSDQLRRFAQLARTQESPTGEAPCHAATELFPPSGVCEKDLINALRWHDNRYAFISADGRRTGVRFSWTAIAMAEIRDLNRHRTGQKYCPLVPVGFYDAADQLPTGTRFPPDTHSLGDQATASARAALGKGQRPGFVGWLLLGSQFLFEHTTSFDKFVYEAALRTGPGTHYRYATHLREAVEALKRSHPELGNAVPLGLSEPE